MEKNRKILLSASHIKEPRWNKRKKKQVQCTCEKKFKKSKKKKQKKSFIFMQSEIETTIIIKEHKA